MKILIVEDNPANMKLVSDLLKKQGYGVLEAMDAEAGIRLARDKLPNLILMDIQLPDMDGLTAARLIKNDDRTTDIPIVALTAFAMDGDRDKMMETGSFDAYVSKPIRYKEFLKTVVSILKADRDG